MIGKDSTFATITLMTSYDFALLLWQVALGFSLSATTGLRAFLPLFVTSVAAKFGYLTLGSSFAWMQSDPALIVFGAAVVFEIAGDKIPALDHALDAAGVFVKPTAATILAGSMFTQMDPVMACVAGLVTGGVVAGGVHVVKAKVRLASSVTTLGTANPVVSLAEDVAAVIGIVLAIVIPVLAAVMIASILAVLTFFAVRWWTRRKNGAVVPVKGVVVA